MVFGFCWLVQLLEAVATCVNPLYGVTVGMLLMKLSLRAYTVAFEGSVEFRWCLYAA